MMLRDLESMPEKENWTMLVKRLLCTLGFNNVWVAQVVGNVNNFLNLVKQRLHDNFIQHWNSRLTDSRRAFLYKHKFVSFSKLSKCYKSKKYRK